MAKIDEEKLLIRISYLIRDTVSVANTTFVTETLRSDVESYVASQFAGIDGVVVEVDDLTNSGLQIPIPTPTPVPVPTPTPVPVPTPTPTPTPTPVPVPTPVPTP